MKKQLPYAEPPFCTYHHMASHGVIALQNPTGYMWFLNDCVPLCCDRRFLSGYGSPGLWIAKFGVFGDSSLVIYQVSAKFCPESMMQMVRRMLDEDYYVVFDHVDDYYIDGKSFFGERHFYHDGLILGYDDEKGTFTLVAYNGKMQYAVFETPISSFEQGMNAALDADEPVRFLAVKSKFTEEKLDLPYISDALAVYLDSDFDRYPVTGTGDVRGVVVHDYLVLYLEALADGSIPHDKLDWRIMRLLWEHKKCMLDRLRAVEKALDISDEVSRAYEAVVSESDSLRMLYAMYHKKPSKTLISMMERKLHKIKEDEQALLGSILCRLRAAGHGTIQLQEK